MSDIRSSKVDLLSTKDLDMHQRKVINAAGATDGSDYTTLDDVRGILTSVISDRAINFSDLSGSYITKQRRPTRNLNTVYKNPGARPLFVLAGLNLTATYNISTSSCVVYSDATPNPVTIVTQAVNWYKGLDTSFNLLITIPVFFIVMPHAYYQATVTSGTVSINYWSEWS